MYNLREMQIEQPLRTGSGFVNRHFGKKFHDVKPKTSSVSNLNSRIEVVRSQLHILKEQVHREKMLLREEQLKAYIEIPKANKTINRFGTPSSCNAYGAAIPSTFELEEISELPQAVTVLTGPSRKRLEDIELQCSNELVKLGHYLNSISELKSCWKEAIESVQF